MSVSREEARAIAEAHLAKTAAGSGAVQEASSPSAASRVETVRDLTELQFRPPLVYGVDVASCWIAYVGPQESGIHSSQVVLIDKERGAVLYAGSANDEG